MYVVHRKFKQAISDCGKFCKRLPSHAGQEQACSRITWLFGWLVVTMPKMAEYTEK